MSRWRISQSFVVCQQLACVFTVYGCGAPRYGSVFTTKAILNGEAIPVFNKGKMIRDFHFTLRYCCGGSVIIAPATQNGEAANARSATGAAPYRIFNIGNGRPVP